MMRRKLADRSYYRSGILVLRALRAKVPGLWAQCDSEGRQFMIIRDIVGHRKNATAITKGSPEATYEAGNGNQVPTKTTKGVDIEVEFCNGETIWMPMIDVKDSNPIELAKYVYAQQINDEPAF